MPQDRPVPGSAGDWLARAEGDLALAQAPLPGGAFLAMVACREGSIKKPSWVRLVSRPVV